MFLHCLESLVLTHEFLLAEVETIVEVVYLFLFIKYIIWSKYNMLLIKNELLSKRLDY